MIGGILAGALTMIALQVFGADRSRQGGINGPARAGALLEWVSAGVQQLVSADKAAIPNLTGAGKPVERKGAPATPSPGSAGGVEAGNVLPKNPPLQWT